MSTNYGGADLFPLTVPVPDDGDPPKASSWDPAYEALADRAQALLNSLTPIKAYGVGTPLVTINSAAWTELVHVDIPYSLVANLDQIEAHAVVNGTLNAGVIAGIGIFFYQITGASAGFADSDGDSMVELAGYSSGGIVVAHTQSLWLIDGSAAHFSDGTIRVILKAQVPGGAPDTFPVSSASLLVRRIKGAA